MFRKKYDWARSNRARLGAIGAAFTAVWLWVMLITTLLGVLSILGILSSDGDGTSQLFTKMLPLGMQSFTAHSLSGSLLGAFLGACVLAPLVEETFRAALCQVCTENDGRMRYHFLLIAGSFLGFGLLHGGGYYSIFIQGVLGLALGLLWFRTNRKPDGGLEHIGPDGHKRWPWWPWLANVFVHASYNFCLLAFQVFIVRSQMG